MNVRKSDDLSLADWQDQKTGTTPDQELRKLRIAELDADKQKLEVAMSEVQSLPRLSGLNERLRNVVRELNELK